MSERLLKIFCLGFCFFALAVFPAVGQAYEGILLQKDLMLGSPIHGAEDLPQEITFNLYDSQMAVTPVGTQAFQKGQYSVDFQFSKSDGITSGDVARLSAVFTSKLNISDNQTKEIWLGIEVAGSEVGDRTRVSDETLVQLLLASDASIVTYLTLAYEGDDNPITTIYRDLPISTLSSDGADTSYSNYFSALFDDTRVSGASDNLHRDVTTENIHIKNRQPQIILENDRGTTGSWSINNNNGHLNFDSPSTAFANRKVTFKSSGNVGIGTTSPTYELAVNGTIRCKQLIVDTGWADFVFEKDYRLPPLSEVEQYIKDNGHLPGIPSDKEVKESGISVGDISSKLLQKIEELTLYLVELKRENQLLKQRVESIEKANHN